jgi:hypothetical protein
MLSSTSYYQNIKAFKQQSTVQVKCKQHLCCEMQE